MIRKFYPEFSEIFSHYYWLLFGSSGYSFFRDNPDYPEFGITNHIQQRRPMQEGLTIPAELYSLNLPESSGTSNLQLFCLKMFDHSLLITGAKRIKKSSPRFLSWGILLNGVCLTQEVGFPKSENASTLSDIIEPTVPEKYFVSRNAAARICSRSSEERRGKGSTTAAELPAHNAQEMAGRAYIQDFIPLT